MLCTSPSRPIAPGRTLLALHSPGDPPGFAIPLGHSRSAKQDSGQQWPFGLQSSKALCPGEAQPGNVERRNSPDLQGEGSLSTDSFLFKGGIPELELLLGSPAAGNSEKLVRKRAHSGASLQGSTICSCDFRSQESHIPRTRTLFREQLLQDFKVILITISMKKIKLRLTA